MGTQLGLSEQAVIEWRGQRGLRRPGPLPLLFGGQECPPKILLLHLGGNNLGLMKGKALVIQAIKDFKLIQRQCPGVLLILSAMLPQIVWRGEGDTRCLDCAQRKANRELQRAFKGGLGIYLPHPGIQVKFLDLYRPAGIHRVFLEDLKQRLQVARWAQGLKMRFSLVVAGFQFGS